MLLVQNLSKATEALVAGKLSCPHQGCGGQLAPWGWARWRSVRLRGGRYERHRPRRGICRRCRRTEVLAELRSLPRRADAVETVGAALLAAADGSGFRTIGDELGVPPTTVRGWLQRAVANSQTVWQSATRWRYVLDPNADLPHPAGTALQNMLDAVGLALAALVRRFGPVDSPWQTATMLGAVTLPSPPGRAVSHLPRRL
jgi:hypothetical protein